MPTVRMPRRQWLLTLLSLAMALSLTGCIGQISRADFDREVARRGNGMTDELVNRAFAAFAQQFPNGKVAQLIVERNKISVAKLVPDTVRDLDGYEFHYADNTWRNTGPLKVLADYNSTADDFDPLAVSGLRHLSTLAETTIIKSGLTDATVNRAAVDDASEPDRNIWVYVGSDRGDYVARFTLAGVFVDGKAQ